MKRWLKRIFLGLAGLIALLLVLMIGLAALLWFKPEIFLTESRLRQALRYAPEGVKADWKKLELKFEPIGWKGKRITLAAENLTFAYNESFDLAVDRADIAISMRWKGFKPKITQVDRISLALAHFTLKPSTPSEEILSGPLPDLRPPPFSSIYPEEIDLSLLQDFDLRVAKVTIESAEGSPFTGAIDLRKISSGQESAKLKLHARAAQAPDLKAELNANLTLTPAAPALEGDAKAEGSFSGWKGEFPFHLKWSDAIRIDGNPDLRSRPHRLNTKISLVWQNSGLDFRLSSFASNTIWKQGRLETHECVVKSSFDQTDGYPKTTDLNCGLTARPKNRLIPTLNAQLNAQVELEPENEEEFAMRFSVNESSADSFLISRLEAKGGMNFNRGKIESPILDLKLSAEIPKFQAWKEAWEGTPLAIPAPLHVMDGTLALKVNSKITNSTELLADAAFSSQLKSAAQSFITSTTGTLHITDLLKESRRIKIDALAKLKDIRLEAPPLRIEEPPQFLPDNRFVTTEQVAKEAKEKAEEAMASTPGLEWSLKLETEQPVRVKTNLFEADLPVAVNLVLGSAAEMAGHIEVQPMPINVFRKRAQLQKLRLTFNPGSKSAALDGRLDYRNPEVLIKILLLGNTETPRVEFMSEPPLSRDQIVSVLLFNKSLAELSEEEVSSAQNMSQALSDGALGLFSLFFLSSTPIQSVGYDPVTQSYSARVSLGGKTTLSVGSDFVEAREFGLRRRLGGPWAIRTELRQELDRPDVVLTLLEWFKRF